MHTGPTLRHFSPTVPISIPVADSSLCSKISHSHIIIIYMWRVHSEESLFYLPPKMDFIHFLNPNHVAIPNIDVILPSGKSLVLKS